jgi:hypothetical protein
VGKIVMKILLADEHLLFREMVRNKQISGMVHFTGHVAGQSALIGASHG